MPAPGRAGGYGDAEIRASRNRGSWRALVYERPWEIVLRDVPAVEPSAGEVRVEIHASGICGSDVHGYTGSTGRRTPPLVMGHEIAGVVGEVGEGVAHVTPGERVALHSILACGECERCAAGTSNTCLNRRLLGIHLPGGYAEAVAVPAAMIHRLPEDVSWEEAAMVEPLAVALHALRLTPVEAGGGLTIIGAGAIGLLVLLAARLGRARPLFVVDQNPRRLELATALGADGVVDAREQDAVEHIRAVTGGVGTGAVIDAVGVGATARQSVTIARSGGHVTWIGNLERRVEVDLQDLVGREICVRGAYGSNDEFGEAIEAIRMRTTDVRPLIERVAPLEDGPALMRGLATGELDAVKVILRPT